MTASEAAELAKAFASLVWPLIVVGALLIFRGPVKRALDQVSEGGGTVEVFGVKVNVGKATEEQQALIEDLQKQIRALHDHLGLDPAAAVAGAESVQAAPRAPASPPRANPRLLWVDDVPDNNRLLVASLRSRGFDVTEVTSTDAALAAFAAGRFDAVVSDMGRGRDRAAGLALTRALRERDKTVPVLIFSSNKAAAVYRAEALTAGANVITDSATIVMQALLDLQAPA